MQALLLSRRQFQNSGTDRSHLLRGRHAVSRRRRNASEHLAAQSGYPNHVELVQVGAEYGQKLEALQQRIPLVERFLQNARVELQPAQLAIYEQRCISHRTSSHSLITAFNSQNATAAMIPAAGIVIIHAQTIRPANPHRTADIRFAAPTPTIDPVMVCVVLTGIPKRVAIKMANAPPVSAAKPPTGRSLVMREPIVATMRHPPNRVPSEIAL